MKIIIEKNIPFIKGMLDSVAEISYLAPEDITPETMRDADALITRTRTRCDAKLLDGSKCRFIATATIGTDHIDLDYCRNHSITVINAPGCNAPAVAQYVFSVIAGLRGLGTDFTLGVVGAGHVGSIIIDWARKMGITTLVCDPPRADAEGKEGFSDIEEIARCCDVITFHTPMTRDGKYPTFHLLDHDLVDKMERRPLIINSARGPVTDTQALLYGLESGKIGNVAIDCWENEPNISPELLRLAEIATPHIAGYSREGKIRATRMALDAVISHFGLPDVEMAEKVPAGAADNVTLSSVAASYNPLADTEALKSSPELFEHLRNNYNYRPETR